MSLRNSLNKLFHSKVNPTNASSEIAQPVEDKKEHPNLDKVEDSQVRIGLERNLFSHMGKAIPILATGSGSAFHNLQIRGEVFAGNDVVLENKDTNKVVAVIERHYATVGNVFTIFSIVPAYTDEKRANLFKYDQDMYTFAEVKPCGKVWNVVLEGDSDPSFTIHRIVRHTSRHFPTTHVIRKEGAEVAWTRYGEGDGNSFILTIDAGLDPSFMVCLAIIADEADK